jgi:putative transcriptional regulator
MKTIHPDYLSLVKAVRRGLHISQENLARELEVIYTTINRWENGLIKPPKLTDAQLDT